MDTREIEIFLKIVETKSFSATAEAMYVSRSVVTYTIKKMETALGVKLLERNSHEIKLTQAGEYFYEDMTELWTQWNHAMKRIRKVTPKREPLMIGMISMTLEEDFGRIIGQFMKALPTIPLQLEVCSVEDPSRLVRSEEMDVAFMYQDTVGRYPELESVPLVRIPLYCVVSRDHRLANRESITLKDLAGERIIGFPQEINRTLDVLVELGQRIRVTLGAEVSFLRADDMAYGISFVQQNAGITFSPVYPPTLQEHVSLAYIPVEDFQEYLDICIVWKKGKNTPEVRELIRIAQEYFQEEM